MDRWCDIHDGESYGSSEDIQWARGIVWYQIMPERFRNGDPGNDPLAEEIPWASMPSTSIRYSKRRAFYVQHANRFTVIPALPGRDAFSDEITDLSESEGRIDVKGKGFRILVSE